MPRRQEPPERVHHLKPTDSSLRNQICDIGRRIYARGFAAGNDGNISVRLDGRRVLCTPTLVCKGFLSPRDLCVVDLDGRQVAGARKCTSEVLLHLEIYRSDADARAVVHCHPPHATAFGVAGIDIPTGILPEVEVFLGVVPLADYETPGGERFARTIRPFIGAANTVVLSNHGTVSWSGALEQAYWQTEILDAYCRILMLASNLGNVKRLPADKVRELLELRAAWGMPDDPRLTGRHRLYVNEQFGLSENSRRSRGRGRSGRKART